jgi:hypothetical protein
MPDLTNVKSGIIAQATKGERLLIEAREKGSCADPQQKGSRRQTDDGRRGRGEALMKRSKSVTLVLVPLFASLALSCTKKVCVDKTGTVVNESRCDDEEQRQHAQPNAAPFYYWHYVPRGHGYPYGSRAGGSIGDYYVPGHESAFSGGGEEGISRGGFGESAVGHGNGE